MKERTKRTLENLVESHLHSIIINSISISRHSKRKRRTILASDVLSALKINGTPIDLPTNAGYSDNTIIDLNDFLNKDSSTTTAATAATATTTTKDNNDDDEIGGGASTTHHNLITNEAPSEMGMVMHWLAVEGRQPKTPLNPIAILNQHEAEYEQLQQKIRQQLQRQQHGRLDINALDKDYYNTKVSNDDDDDHDHGDDNIATSNKNGGNDDTEDDDDDDEQVKNNSLTTLYNNSKDHVAIRNLLPRLLSEELQLYFTRITLALQKINDTHAQNAALSRLRYDSGIQELVPFFLNFLTPTSNAQMANVQRSRLRIQCIYNLALNPNLHLELYLEKVVPLVLNCIVPKKLSHNPYDHWKLRDEASRTLLVLWTIFGTKYPNFQSSVIRVLCEAMAQYGIESRYGALIALGDLGPKVVDAVVLPYIGKFWLECESALKDCQRGNIGDEGKQYSLYRLQDALLYTMSVFLQSGVINRLNTLDSEKTSHVFGDRLVPFYGSNITDSSEYFTCFV